MKCSIIIVTRNRAVDLAETLEAMRVAHVPDGMKVELVVIDNGSTDNTRDVVGTSDCGEIEVRYFVEQKPGKCRGLNLGLAESGGDILLFTDDDVRPSVDWIAGMCEPIIDGRGDAVSGGVHLAPHLVRPWMTPVHRSWLADTGWLERDAPQSMVGANMAFSRKVLEKVPGFDPELGPGASGFGDDALLASQFVEAGYKIYDALDVSIDHHFEPTRLERDCWLGAAEKRGVSHAYRGHHWEHWGCRFGQLKVLRAKAKLAAWRSRNSSLMSEEEGCSCEELDLVFDLALVRGHLKESRRKRNYERHGLVKIA